MAYLAYALEKAYTDHETAIDVSSPFPAAVTLLISR